MLDTVLLELEGVIADTGEARRDAVQAALRADGIHLTAAEYREQCAGLSFEAAIRGAWQVAQRAPDDTAIALAAHRAERTYRAYIGKGLTLVEGARETLERLHDTVRLALVTRAPRNDAMFVLSLARVEHLFTCVVAAEDALPKPSPEPYRLALTRLQRTRARVVRGTVVAVEDGLPGIRAARAAGIACVAVGDIPAHVAVEADGYVPSIGGLTADALLSLVAPRSEPIV